MQAQRTALALSNGVVLIAWASHEDLPPFHGWIMGYDAATLAKVGTFCVTPDGYYGGIWQGGRAPTIDAAGNAYFATGNGYWDGTRNFSESLLKFSVSRAGLDARRLLHPRVRRAQFRRLRPERLGIHPPARHEPAPRRRQGGRRCTCSTLPGSDTCRRTTARSRRRSPLRAGMSWGALCSGTPAAAGPLIYNWSEDDVLRAYQHGTAAA